MVVWNRSAPLMAKPEGAILRVAGQVYCRKVTKNFGQWRFLSAREIEHVRFRALFADEVWAKMQNGRTCTEALSSQHPQHSAKTDRKGKTNFTAKPLHGADAEVAEKDQHEPYAN
jgi:hypothetical protein